MSLAARGVGNRQHAPCHNYTDRCDDDRRPQQQQYTARRRSICRTVKNNNRENCSRIGYTRDRYYYDII